MMATLFRVSNPETLKVRKRCVYHGNLVITTVVSKVNSVLISY